MSAYLQPLPAPSTSKRVKTSAALEATHEPSSDDQPAPNPYAHVKKVLALHVTLGRDPTLGAAAIDLETGELGVLMRTSAWIGDVEFLTGLILRLLHPIDMVVTGSKLEESAYVCIKAACQTFSEQQREGQELELTMRPSVWFDSEAAVKRLKASVNFNEITDGKLDVCNVVSLGCIGAVLATCSRIRSDEGCKVTSIELFDLAKFMGIDNVALRALDIAKFEEHPSLIRGRGRSKEGFSLLSLLDRTLTNPGKKLLRQWILRPSTEIEVLHERHAAVEYLSTSQIGMDMCAKTLRRLRGIQDIPSALLRIKQCRAKHTDWISLGESIANAELVLVELAQALQLSLEGFGGDSRLLPTLLVKAAEVGMLPELSTAGEALDIIDWDNTRILERAVPRGGISEEVDAARERMSQLDAILHHETRRVQQDTSLSLTFRYIPLIGFVIAAPENLQLGASFEAHFQAKAYTEEGNTNRYFKNHRARELDEAFGDLVGEVRACEDAVVREIETKIISLETVLLLVSHRVAEFDVLRSFSDVARDFDYVRPELIPEPCFEVAGARHPLLERTLDRFVQNDLFLPKGKVLVITGPNYSGKSVLLKTVALISILAQIGSFVPASRARLGIVDRLFTRIQSFETISRASLMQEGVSSFSIDVQQIANMIHSCTPNSLLLIDEFGKGTCSFDGAALLAASLEYLTSGACGTPPLCVATTHLVEILEPLREDSGSTTPALLNDGSNVSLAEMCVEFHGNDAIPLFHIELGHSSKESYGIACCRRAGVPVHVVNRALSLSERSDCGAFEFLDAEEAEKQVRRVEAFLNVPDWGKADATRIQDLIVLWR